MTQGWYDKDMQNTEQPPQAANSYAFIDGQNLNAGVESL
jgi:hypothetical protein